MSIEYRDQNRDPYSASIRSTVTTYVEVDKFSPNTVRICFVSADATATQSIRLSALDAELLSQMLSEATMVIAKTEKEAA